MEYELRVLFSSDNEDNDCCNLIVSRKDPDGVEDIIASIDGTFARFLYEVLTDNLR